MKLSLQLQMSLCKLKHKILAAEDWELAKEISESFLKIFQLSELYSELQTCSEIFRNIYFAMSNVYNKTPLMTSTPICTSNSKIGTSKTSILCDVCDETFPLINNDLEFTMSMHEQSPCHIEVVQSFQFMWYNKKTHEDFNASQKLKSSSVKKAFVDESEFVKISSSEYTERHFEDVSYSSEYIKTEESVACAFEISDNERSCEKYDQDSFLEVSAIKTSDTLGRTSLNHELANMSTSKTVSSVISNKSDIPLNQSVQKLISPNTDDESVISFTKPMKKSVNPVFNKPNSNPVQKSPAFIKGRSFFQTIAEKAIHEFAVSHPVYSQDASKFRTSIFEEVQPNNKLSCEKYINCTKNDTLCTVLSDKMANTIESIDSDTESDISLPVTTCKSFDTLNRKCFDTSSNFQQSSRTSVTEASDENTEVVSNNENFVNENINMVNNGVILKNGALYCTFCRFWLKNETKNFTTSYYVYMKHIKGRKHLSYNKSESHSLFINSNCAAECIINRPLTISYDELSSEEST